MNIEIFALCDAATESEGKVSLLGAFDSLVPRIPARDASEVEREIRSVRRSRRLGGRRSS